MINKLIPRELKDALKRTIEGTSDLQDPATCKHLRKIGDDNGISCRDCGSTLEGYGHLAKGSKTCLHKYAKYKVQEICIYCEQLKPIEN